MEEKPSWKKKKAIIDKKGITEEKDNNESPIGNLGFK